MVPFVNNEGLVYFIFVHGYTRRHSVHSVICTELFMG